ncbi:hypothetical protein LTR36_004877 [Oleoguttula mirabilis]|uniref:Uncharacterized protein n=1 Tax=Oleoguttula mirabilis TaxID=1507867 RepID=A0AAV9JG42_9PEZI|nr:hypothetical protein LTR36_004877 [Oleoguttula mirabilis]
MASKDALIARIFNHTYHQELQQAFPNGRSVTNIKDDCRAAAGHLQGRSKMWKVITARPHAAEQQQREQAVMGLLRATIQSLGLGQQVMEVGTQSGGAVAGGQVQTPATTNATVSPPLAGSSTRPFAEAPTDVSEANKGSTPSVSDNSKAVASGTATPQNTNSALSGSSGDSRKRSFPNAFSGEMADGQGAQSIDTTPAANNSNSTSPNTSSAELTSGQDGIRSNEGPPVNRESADHSTQLQMLHYSNFFWNRLQAHAPTTTLIDPDSALYKLGGKVYRARRDDGAEEDIMLCNRDMCDRCRDHSQSASARDAAAIDAARVCGQPFIHTYDSLMPTHRQYRVFTPKGNPRYSSRYPQVLWRTVVCLRMQDGEKRVMDAVMCDADSCPKCLPFRVGESMVLHVDE